MIKVSAPGKVHLIGEHAAVYGEPAIIAAIGKRCHVQADKADDVRIESRELNTERIYPLSETIAFTKNVQKLWDTGFEAKNFSQLFGFMKRDGMYPAKAAIGKALISLGIDNGVTLKISSDVPIGSGLGSSSSMSVAIVKAIAELYKKNLTLEQINEIAFSIEQFNHGTPSGGDNSACCYGGLIWFQKSNPKNIIQSLKAEIPYKLENFVLVNVGKPEKTTGELVQHVRNLPEDFRNPRIKAIGAATMAMRDALEQKDFGKMKALINFAQRYLAELGVSTKEIDDVSKAVLSIGGAAKLCGAGGGGTVLCYHENKNKVIQAIQELGYTPMEVELGTEGVRKD
ncbi:MAG: mevalonate kinase [Candidatus Aenigmarchaeota archaeon]|nr:mevalonate kinase [Candidatus Aenigmarchaeota archaeon]